MNKKRIIFLIIGYIIFSVVFITSTSMVLSIPVKNLYGVRKIKTNEYDKLPALQNYRVDTFIENEDILFTVEYTGWAFIQSGQDHDNKEIKLVFISGDNRYEVKTELQERFDIKAILVKNNMSGFKHGFITKFSPLQMKNGIYALYLYCQENEKTSGIVDTGLQYIKTYRAFSEYEGEPLPVTNEEAVPDTIK